MSLVARAVRRRPRTGSVLTMLLALTLATSACGSDDSAVDAADSMGDMGEMSDSADGMAMNMGDPSATRADALVDAELASGSFELLDTRPQGYDATTGTAWVARHDDGTTVTIELQGLLSDTDYISHLHNDICANNGGDHYQFEVGGSELPPNEIHLAFTSDAEGNGFMTAENDRTAGPDAVAIVVHPVELIDNKIACAEFATADS